jgi:hypothetical protein
MDPYDDGDAENWEDDSTTVHPSVSGAAGVSAGPISVWDARGSGWTAFYFDVIG